jgi:hypothetical protein
MSLYIACWTTFLLHRDALSNYRLASLRRGSFLSASLVTRSASAVRVGHRNSVVALAVASFSSRASMTPRRSPFLWNNITSWRGPSRFTAWSELGGRPSSGGVRLVRDEVRQVEYISEGEKSDDQCLPSTGMPI